MSKPERLRVLCVLGTRPEAIKMAPVIQALQAHPAAEALVCVTAQHRQMLDQTLALFQIKPQYDLNLMAPDQSLAQLSAAIFTAIDPVLQETRPDWVLIQGDTTTVMVTALAAFYQRIAVGHVEAGLRSGDKWQPFPEEINRRIASVVADLHFAPTPHSRQNLLNEGIPHAHIVLTGNTVVDALNQILRRDPPAEFARLMAESGVLPSSRVILVTAHRRENFGSPLEDICQALKTLAETHADSLHIFYPVHLNPKVQETVYPCLKGIPNIHLLAPLDYLPLIHLLKRSCLVLTDSGGIQEEATSLRKPALVLRQVTERPEGIASGILQIVGSDPQRIVTEANRWLDGTVDLPGNAEPNPFGDGNAAGRIVQALFDYPRTALTSTLR